jgi:hypothetical protein
MADVVFDNVVGGARDIIAAGPVSCHCRFSYFYFLISYQVESYAAEE